MRQEMETSQAKSARSVKIVSDYPADRVKAIHDAVAHRAYHIFESRGFAPGHDSEDWLLAESEIVRPLQYGLLELDGRMTLTTDASCFEWGEIIAYIEPRCVTLSGKAGPCKEHRKEQTAESDLSGELVFRALDLPVEVDPSGVQARFNGCMLELSLPKAGAARETRAQAKAA
jgi:HSP20 family molecular chaperone IbpA